MKKLALTALACSVPLLIPTSAGAAKLKFFDSPDHNISCAMVKGSKKKHFKGGVRCDILNKAYTTPRPRNCEFDSGGGASLGQKGRARGECVSDAIEGQGGVLAAGGRVRTGRFVCTLDALGTTVSCSNLRNGHGFTLTPATYSFY